MIPEINMKMKEKHHLGPNDLKSLPEKIANPLFILRAFNSNTKQDEKNKRNDPENSSKIAVVRTGGLPFELKISPGMKEPLEAVDDINNGRNLSREFTSVDELMEDLNA